MKNILYQRFQMIWSHFRLYLYWVYLNETE